MHVNCRQSPDSESNNFLSMLGRCKSIACRDRILILVIGQVFLHIVREADLHTCSSRIAICSSRLQQSCYNIFLRGQQSIYVLCWLVPSKRYNIVCLIVQDIQVYFPILGFISIYIYIYETRIIFGLNVGLKEKTASQNLSINTRRVLAQLLIIPLGIGETSSPDVVQEKRFPSASDLKLADTDPI